MKRANVSQIVDALTTALRRIGTDETWCTTPMVVDRSVSLPAFEAIARPAIAIEEPAWSDFAPETMGGDEYGVADLTIRLWLIAGTDGLTSAVMDELHGLAEDAVRAIREDFQLNADDPDAVPLVQYLLRGTFELQEEATIETQVGIATLTFTGRLPFVAPSQGAV